MIIHLLSGIPSFSFTTPDSVPYKDNPVFHEQKKADLSDYTLDKLEERFEKTSQETVLLSTNHITNGFINTHKRSLPPT